MAFFVVDQPVFAEDPETLSPSNDLYVTDNLNLLSTETKNIINQRNQSWKNTETKPEVAVVIIDDVGDYGDVDVFADYLVRQPQWQIGNQEFDNGVLILFALNNGQNNMRISTGYGAEGVLPDVLTFRIMQENLALIKSNDRDKIDEGVRNVFNQTADYIDQIAGDASDIQQDDSDDFVWIILLIVILIIISFFFSDNGGGGYNGWSTSGIWIDGLFGSGRGRSSGGGSFGGGSFGGGSFGGGGSSV